MTQLVKSTQQFDGGAIIPLGAGAGRIARSDASGLIVWDPVSSSYRKEIMADNPILYWRNHAASGTVEVDESGTGSNGTINGGATLGAVGGLTGDADTAITLDGVNDQITRATLAAMTSFTVECWFKPNGNQVDNAALIKDEFLVSNVNFAMMFAGGGNRDLLAGIYKGSWSKTAVYTLTDATWHHCVFTYDNTTMRLYADRSLRQSAGGPSNPATDGLNFQVGGANAAFAKGTIDEIAIYNTALSLARIQAHYDAGTTTPTGPTDRFATFGNLTTAETDMLIDSIPAAWLATNGDKVRLTLAGQFVGSTSSKQLKAYFAGTAVFDSGAIAISTGGDWCLEVIVIRESSTVVRTIVQLNTGGASTAVYTKYTRITGLTLTNPSLFRLTGTASGVGAASNDATATMTLFEKLAAQ